MLTTILVLLALGGVITQSAQDDLGGCLYTPDANGHVNVPNNVTSIGDTAFKGCSLVSIGLPDGLMSIGVSSFQDCLKLTSIVVPNSVTSIGDTAFSGCIRLAAVALPDENGRIKLPIYIYIKAVGSVLLS